MLAAGSAAATGGGAAAGAGAALNAAEALGSPASDGHRRGHAAQPAARQGQREQNRKTWRAQIAPNAILA